MEYNIFSKTKILIAAIFLIFSFSVNISGKDYGGFMIQLGPDEQYFFEQGVASVEEQIIYNGKEYTAKKTPLMNQDGVPGLGMCWNVYEIPNNEYSIIMQVIIYSKAKISAAVYGTYDMEGNPYQSMVGDNKNYYTIVDYEFSWLDENNEEVYTFIFNSYKKMIYIDTNTFRSEMPFMLDVDGYSFEGKFIYEGKLIGEDEDFSILSTNMRRLGEAEDLFTLYWDLDTKEIQIYDLNTEQYIVE
jgi:hypothetical protein